MLFLRMALWKYPLRNFKWRWWSNQIVLHFKKFRWFILHLSQYLNIFLYITAGTFMYFRLTEGTTKRRFPLWFWCLCLSLKKWRCSIFSDWSIDKTIIIDVARLYWRSIFNSGSLSCQGTLQRLAQLLAFKCWLFYNFW